MKYLTMYIKVLEKVVRKKLAEALRYGSFNERCKHVKPGVFSCCNNEFILALYKVKDWPLGIHELSHVDYVYCLRRFLDVFQIESCRTIFYSDIEPLDINEYLAKLNRKIQMKLIELELDKTNVRLRNYVERLIENRKKVLMGIRPIKITNFVALACSNTVDLRDLDKLVSNAKTVLNVDLDPIVEQEYAEILANFRSRQY